MPLDRQSIEKKDFPLSRRGYDPAAVDSHLASVADRLESDKPKPETLASTASEQVRTIVAAAEASAAEIRKQAEEEARGTTERAARDAKRVRSDAKQEAEKYVSEVRAATAKMVERIKPLESELGSVLASVRSSGERMHGGLAELERGLAELSTIGGARAKSNGADASQQPTDGKSAEEATAAAGAKADVQPAPEKAAVAEKAAAAESAPEGDKEGLGEEERARLIALDMALSGTPREEAERYLADKSSLEDRDKLLDEIYAKVGPTKKG